MGRIVVRAFMKGIGGEIPGRWIMARVLPEVELTAEQEEEARRIEDILAAKSAVEIRFIARLLASKSNRELLGATEFQIRDAVHRLGAAGIDAALSERKKRGTKGQVLSVPSAAKTPNSTGIDGVRSRR
jgi:hypothetical protein